MSPRLGLIGAAVLSIALSFPDRGETLYIRKSIHLIAWSQDGADALLEIEERGPEGGGSLGYHIVGASGTLAALVSSDFSAGGPDTPQTITQAACREGLSRLEQRFRARGFAGVRARKDNCAKRQDVISVAYADATRDDPAWGTKGKPTLLAISPAQGRLAKESAFAGDGLQLTKGTLSLQLNTTGLELAEGGRAVKSWPFEQRAIGGVLSITGAISATRRLLIVIARRGAESDSILGIFQSPTGNLSDLTAVSSSP